MQQFHEFVIQYGYISVYFFLACGIFGLPLPDEIVVGAVGYFASMGLLTYWTSLFITFFGVLTGTLFTFFLGRKIGKPLLSQFGKWLSITPTKIERFNGWFKKYGNWTVTFGFFIPGVRHLTCYLSGMSGMNLKHYMIYSLIGVSISTLLLVTIGYSIGKL